jgi:hypothetical protein
MSLYDISRVVDTVIGFLETQRPVFDTIIEQYYPGNNRRLEVFFGRRVTIPTSSLPSIEVAPAGSGPDWFACRTLRDTLSLELDVTVDNYDPEHGTRVLTALETLVTRILTRPPHLRPTIQGTQSHLFDALPGRVQYATAGQGKMRVATIPWEGQILEYLANNEFEPYLRVGSPVADPTLGAGGVVR